MSSEITLSDNNSSNEFQEKVGNTVQPSPARHWCFTLNNHQKSDIMTISSNSSSFKDFVFQEETGESGTPHLQGYVCLKRKARLPAVKALLGDRAHVERCNNIDASIKYCSKDESRTGDVYTNIPRCKKVKVIDESLLYTWQERVLEIISAPVDDRLIYWIYDERGNAGKSVFAKYLCVKYGAFMISNKSVDMKAGVTAAINKGLNIDLILVDVPRSIDLQYLSYTGIEEVKNGCFFSPKYESGMCVFNNPHIFIFSNELPDVDKITNDRWRIFEITPLKNKVQLTVDEARTRRLNRITENQGVFRRGGNRDVVNE